MRLLRAAAIAPVTVFAWLLPPTLYGLLYVLFLGTGDDNGFFDSIVGACFLWGYLGFLLVPLIGFGLALQRFGSALIGFLVSMLALALYFPASWGAILMIVMTDSGGVMEFS